MNSLHTLPRRHHSLVARLGLLAGFLVGLAGGDAPAAGTPGKTRLPDFAAVEATVTQYFQSLPGYQRGGILARSEVEPVFARLGKLGWQVADAPTLVGRVLPDQDFLVRKLRTKQGRKLAVQVSAYRLGYDRLDRLARLQNGQRLVNDLIRGPDGYKMIEYMTSSQGGKNLGKQLGNVPKGVDFNKPTGRIYTVEDLLAELKTRHEELVAKGTKGGGRGTKK